MSHAIVEAVGAMDELFAASIVGRLEFPVPSKARRNELWISPPAGNVAKAALYVAICEAGVSKVQQAKQLGVDEKEARWLLDPHYGSKLPRLAEAISLLGQRLVIGLEPARFPLRCVGATIAELDAGLVDADLDQRAARKISRVVCGVPAASNIG